MCIHVYRNKYHIIIKERGSISRVAGDCSDLISDIVLWIIFPLIYPVGTVTISNTNQLWWTSLTHYYATWEHSLINERSFGNAVKIELLPASKHEMIATGTSLLKIVYLKYWNRAIPFPFTDTAGGCNAAMNKTHWRRNKMPDILQMTFSNAFSCMKMYEFRLRFYWKLFERFQITTSQHWFRTWLDADQATSHYVSQWWFVYWRLYASLGLDELRYLNISTASFPLFLLWNHPDLTLLKYRHTGITNLIQASVPCCALTPANQIFNGYLPWLKGNFSNCPDGREPTLVTI